MHEGLLLCYHGVYNWISRICEEILFTGRSELHKWNYTCVWISLCGGWSGQICGLAFHDWRQNLCIGSRKYAYGTSLLKQYIFWEKKRLINQSCYVWRPQIKRLIYFFAQSTAAATLIEPLSRMNSLDFHLGRFRFDFNSGRNERERRGEKAAFDGGGDNLVNLGLWLLLPWA